MFFLIIILLIIIFSLCIILLNNNSNKKSSSNTTTTTIASSSNTTTTTTTSSSYSDVSLFTNIKDNFVNLPNKNTIFYLINGSIYVSGDNSHGQYGTGDFNSTDGIIEINIGSGWSKIKSNNRFSVLGIQNGALYGWGWNFFNELGITGNNITTPTLIDNTKTYIDIYTGYGNFIVVDSNNNLYGCGNNINNYLGLSTQSSDILKTQPDSFVSNFTKIPINPNKWIKGYCFINGYILLDQNGQLWGTGLLSTISNLLVDSISFVKLDLLNTNTYIDLSVSRQGIYIIDTNNNLYYIGNDLIYPNETQLISQTNLTQINSTIKWKSVSANSLFVYVIDTDNKLYGCGKVYNNNFGSLYTNDLNLITLLDDTIKWNQVFISNKNYLYILQDIDNKFYKFSTTENKIEQIIIPTPSPSIIVNTQTTSSISVTNSSSAYTGTINGFTIQNGVLQSYINSNINIIIPKEVISIGTVFQNNNNISQVTFEGNSISRIEPYAFQNCSNLYNITLPNGLLFVGKYAFDGCSILNYIYFPESVIILEDFIFGTDADTTCKNINTIYLLNPDVYIPPNFIPMNRFLSTDNDKVLELYYYKQDTLEALPDNIINFIVNSQEKQGYFNFVGINRPTQ